MRGDNTSLNDSSCMEKEVGGRFMHKNSLNKKRLPNFLDSLFALVRYVTYALASLIKFKAEPALNQSTCGALYV
jgi:hypothetical protein